MLEVGIPVNSATWNFDASSPAVLRIPVLKACSIPSFAPTKTTLSFFWHVSPEEQSESKEQDWVLKEEPS
jgi:hypothetical protein